MTILTRSDLALIIIIDGIKGIEQQNDNCDDEFVFQPPCCWTAILEPDVLVDPEFDFY